MQPSPLQLSEIFFVHTDIKPRSGPDVTTPPAARTRFYFSNTDMTSTVEHAIAPDDENSSLSNVLITLRIILDGDGENPPPYLVDVKCVGYFTISKAAFPDLEKRYDVAVVNGASLLYGAIREQILNTTLRMWYGELLLPAVTFFQNAPSIATKNESAVVQDNEAKPAPRKRASKKS